MNLLSCLIICIIIFIDNETNGAIRELPLRNGGNKNVMRRRMLLPKIIGYFKMNSAKKINQLINKTNYPLWQRNYFEHVIRNGGSLQKIRKYIYNNPVKWAVDSENPSHKTVGAIHELPGS